jgi:phosphate/sulfate permease
VNALQVMALISSALFAWSMGSHYTGSVAGTAYGAGVLSLRAALLITAAFTLVGSVAGSINVVDTYTKVVPQASTIDIVAAQLAAAVMTTASTHFKLPTSTIQLYAFSLLGSALVSGISINGAVFAFIIAGWIGGPLVSLVVGMALSRLGGSLAAKGERALRWFLIAVAIYSAFILGSNDVSNAATSLVTTG